MQNPPKVKILVNLEKNLINKIDLQKKYDKMSPLLQSFVRSYFLGTTQKEIINTMCLTKLEYHKLKDQMIIILKGE
jgi:hypothetical protein